MGRTDERHETDLGRKIKNRRKKKVVAKNSFGVKRAPSTADSHRSDSDLNEPEHLRPIGDYVNNRREMVKQMFNSIRHRHLNLILPDVMKDVPLAELQRLCVEQLDVMSKKRIRYILAGTEMTSSSGTDDSDSDDKSSCELQPNPPCKRSESVQSEIPQPDSTSADQLPVAGVAVNEIIKEAIESDEDVSENFPVNENKTESKSVSKSNSVELEEPIFDFVFDTSDDDDLRARVLPKRTAIDFDSEENEKENGMDSGVLISQTKNISDKREAASPSMSPDTNRSDAPSREDNFLNFRSDLNLSEKSATSDVSDVQKRNRSPTSSSDEDYSEYDGGSELEDGEIRPVKKRRFKLKKFKKSNDKQKISNPNEEQVCSNQQDIRIGYSDQEEVVPACDDAADQQNLPTDGLQHCEDTNDVLPDQSNADVADSNETSAKVPEEDLNLPFENDDFDQLDVDLLPKDDVWMHYNNDFHCDSNKNDDKPDELVEFVDSVPEEKISVTNAAAPRCDELRPKPPPGVVVDYALLVDNEDFEEYESDEDQHPESASQVRLVPPGLEQPVALVKSVSNDDCDSCEPSTSGNVPVPRKSSLIPIKTLYKQLKAQREMEKVKPKIYSAELPAWSVAKPVELTGPPLPSADETVASSIVLSDDKAIVRCVNVDDECKVSSSPKKVKKKSRVLTQEFLDDLKKQKKEHELEMMRKEAMLEKLKKKRLAMVQQEKETEERLKKRNDLGLAASSSNDDAGVDQDSTKCELYLFDDDQSSYLFSDEEVVKYDSIEHEEGEISCDEPTVNAKSLLVNDGDLKSLKVSLNEHGSRSFTVNQKADKMKSAFTLEAENVDDEKNFGTYNRSRSVSRERSSASRGRYDYLDHCDHYSHDCRDKKHQRHFESSRSGYDERRYEYNRLRYDVCRTDSYDRMDQCGHYKSSETRTTSRSEHRHHSSKSFDHRHFSKNCDHRHSSKTSEHRYSSKSSSHSSKRETPSQKIVKANNETAAKKHPSSPVEKKSKDIISPKDDKIIIKAKPSVKPTAPPRKVHIEPITPPRKVHIEPKQIQNENKPIAVVKENVDQVTVQKLELYELEMRARAIRALMKKQESENK